MLQILKEEHKHRHLKGGRPGKLSVLDKLVVMLCYYREYRVMGNIAFDYGVSKSTEYNRRKEQPDNIRHAFQLFAVRA